RPGVGSGIGLGFVVGPDPRGDASKRAAAGRAGTCGARRPKFLRGVAMRLMLSTRLFRLGAPS
ncbi:MAG TPA: hypothetical protein VLL04_00075, partial [Rhizomicrobium sp.]|nr:hypothetical protein [Rhizomicrobium sp.]